MKRPQQPKQRKQRRSISGVHPNYPRRGTLQGEVIIGPCQGVAGCDRVLHRGDMFVVTAADQLLCIDCWNLVPGVDAEMHRKSMEVFDAVMAKHPPDNVVRLHSEKKMEQALIWDGEFPE